MALRADRAIIAGDLLAITGVGSGLSGGLVRCTVKQYRAQADAAAIAECDSLDGGIVVTGDTDFEITFGSDVTEGWPIGRLWYDVQLVTADDEVCTLMRGFLATQRRITRTRSIAQAHAPLTAEVGALVLAAADAELRAGRTIAAETAALSLAAADVNFARALVMPADAGALVLTGADATLTYAVDRAALISYLGSRLHWWFEVGYSTETLNGSNFSQLNDMGPGGYHVTQATAGNQPAKETVGGPNGKPFVNCQGTTRRMSNTAIALSANRALTYYAVSKVAAGGAFRLACGAREGTAEGTGDMCFGTMNGATNAFNKIVKHNGGAEQTIVVTSPAGDTNWHLWSQEYATGAAAVTKIDTTTTTPAPSGTGKCVAVETLLFGHPTVAGGSTAFFICIEDKTATDDAMIRSFVANQYAIIT